MSSVGAQCGREGCRAVGLTAVVTFELPTPTLGNNWAVSMNIEFTLLNTKCLFICVFMCVSKYVHGGPGAHKELLSDSLMLRFAVQHLEYVRVLIYW